MGAYARLSWLRTEIKKRTMMTALDPIATRFARALSRVGPKLVPSPTRETEIRLDDDSTLVLPAGLPSARRLAAAVYEPEVTNLVRSLLRPGMTLVDVGANVGYYTVLAASLVKPTGHVFAFEPELDAYRYLLLNIDRNAAARAVASAVNKALADVDGTMRFIPSALEGGFLAKSGDNASHSAEDSRSLDVETTSLDSFVAERGWPSIDLVKIDAEGSEALVLAGASRVVARNPDMKVIMEVNLRALERAGTTSRDLTELLTKLGFRTACVIEQGLRPINLDDELPSSGLIYNLLVSKQ